MLLEQQIIMNPVADIMFFTNYELKGQKHNAFLNNFQQDSCLIVRKSVHKIVKLDEIW